MSTEIEAQGMAPGANVRTHGARQSYLIGLSYAVVLTLASFWASSTDVIYPHGVPILLGVLAIAQMGIHLVFFLHISSAPDQTNNILALAFGIFVVGPQHDAHGSTDSDAAVALQPIAFTHCPWRSPPMIR